MPLYQNPRGDMTVARELRSGRSRQRGATTGRTVLGSRIGLRRDYYRPGMMADMAAISEANAPEASYEATVSGPTSAEGVDLGKTYGPEPQAMTPAELAGFKKGAWEGYPGMVTMSQMPNAYAAYQLGATVPQLAMRTVLGPLQLMNTLVGGLRGAYAQRGMLDYDPAEKSGYEGAVGRRMGSVHERQDEALDVGEGVPARLGYDPAEAYDMQIGRQLGGYHEMAAGMQSGMGPQLGRDPGAPSGMAIGREMGSQHEKAARELSQEGRQPDTSDRGGGDFGDGGGDADAQGQAEGGFGPGGSGFGDNEGYGGGEGGAHGDDGGDTGGGGDDGGCIAIRYHYGAHSKQWRYAQVFCGRHMSYRDLDGYYRIGHWLIDKWNRWPWTKSFGEKYITRPFYHYMLYRLERESASPFLRFYGWAWMKAFKVWGRKHVKAHELPYGHCVGIKIGE